ncbi:sialic acid-binding periplasmic protein SiaP precursor [Anaerotignum neopropionicum]|uniref:Sialic acid-binding periplasmic protein SiaP n=1 Tax=Anaerotignum neopropionicum TaxID=36847 RepID=A0A136WEQ0_9FIRM|nr:C4-dicarboxylate TRAP transporter substrate-binding protein [Anaerotignum neopropionicum]KXL53008.1 sialic acid-binding periplasmic protein SiaP precursor [Anaerotignum neopropionicum]
MKFKKLIASMCITAISVASLAGCGSKPAETPADQGGAAAPADKVTLQIGFENSMTEPIGQALQKWADLVDEESGGTMEIVLYPDSQLGNKTDLIDSMLLGENVATLADGAFYADYGVPDFGIVFGPFLFDNWDQCWTLIESDWYKEQEAKLEEKGLKLIASNWAYGSRHTLTVKPVNTVADLAGMKIRVPSNQIQTLGFNALGAAATGMSLGDVYQALQTKTIDGAENPLSTLYGRKLHEVAKNLILDGHVLNFTTWVCSSDWFNSLTEEQQNILTKTGKEAGIYNNQIQEESEADYLQKMKDEGVTVVEPTEEVIAGFREKAQSFYEQGDTFGWSEGLYDTVRAAMGAK